MSLKRKNPGQNFDSFTKIIHAATLSIRPPNGNVILGKMHYSSQSQLQPFSINHAFVESLSLNSIHHDSKKAASALSAAIYKKI